MMASCSSYVPINPLKVTILERMLVKQSSTLVKLLDVANLRIMESNQYPFFKLIEA